MASRYFIPSSLFKRKKMPKYFFLRGKIQNNVTIFKSAAAAEAPSKETLDKFGIAQIVTLQRTAKKAPSAKAAGMNRPTF